MIMNILQDLKQQYRIGDLSIKLIFINIVLFAVPTLVVSLLQLFYIKFDYFQWVLLSENLNEFVYKPWTLISYSFFHSGLVHLVFNMLALFYTGRLFTTFFTQKQFLAVYILGGVFAGVLYLFSCLFIPVAIGQRLTLIGSSASIMAVLFATTTYMPFMNVRIPLIGNIPVLYIALAFLFAIIIQLPLNNVGGQIAHLGGAIFGFIYIKALQQGVDFGKGLNQLLDAIANLFSRKKTTPFKSVHRNTQSKSSKNTYTSSRVVKKDMTQQQIDEILDKIGQSGYDSLTKEEKDFLFRAGK